jgi:hypothetical protein
MPMDTAVTSILEKSLFIDPSTAARPLRQGTRQSQQAIGIRSSFHPEVERSDGNHGSQHHAGNATGCEGQHAASENGFSLASSAPRHTNHTSASRLASA